MDAHVHFCKSLQHSSDPRLLGYPADSLGNSKLSIWHLGSSLGAEILWPIRESHDLRRCHEKAQSEVQGAVMSQCSSGRQSRVDVLLTLLSPGSWQQTHRGSGATSQDSTLWLGLTFEDFLQLPGIKSDPSWNGSKFSFKSCQQNW